MAISYFKKQYMKEEWMEFDKKIENAFLFCLEKGSEIKLEDNRKSFFYINNCKLK